MQNKWFILKLPQQNIYCINIHLFHYVLMVEGGERWKGENTTNTSPQVQPMFQTSYRSNFYSETIRKQSLYSALLCIFTQYNGPLRDGQCNPKMPRVPGLLQFQNGCYRILGILGGSRWLLRRKEDKICPLCPGKKSSPMRIFISASALHQPLILCQP